MNNCIFSELRNMDIVSLKNLSYLDSNLRDGISNRVIYLPLDSVVVLSVMMMMVFVMSRILDKFECLSFIAIQFLSLILECFILLQKLRVKINEIFNLSDLSLDCHFEHNPCFHISLTFQILQTLSNVIKAQLFRKWFI